MIAECCPIMTLSVGCEAMLKVFLLDSYIIGVHGCASFQTLTCRSPEYAMHLAASKEKPPGNVPVVCWNTIKKAMNGGAEDMIAER